MNPVEVQSAAIVPRETQPPQRIMHRLTRGHLPPAVSDFSLKDYWNVIEKRKWTVLTTLIIIVTLIMLWSFQTTPLFEATARMAVYREDTNDLGLRDSMGMAEPVEYDYTVQLDTQVEIIESDAVALQVIRDLRLDSHPLFATSRSAPAAKPTAVPAGPVQFDNAEEAELLDLFKGNMRVNSVPHTRLIDITYTSPDPKVAAEVANAIVHAYVERNFRTKFESTMQTSEWLAKQLSDLQLKVESSQEKLVRYQREKGILGLDEKQNIITTKLEELNKELMAAEGDRMQKEAAHKIAAAGNEELIARADNGTIITKLRSELAELRSQHARLATQFGPSYPRVMELRNQMKELEGAIQDEIQRLSKGLETDYQTALARERMLAQAFEKQKRAANELNESAIQYTLLKREVETNRQLYEGLLQKLKEASVSVGLRSNNVRIVDAARVPLIPTKPNIPRNILLGLLAGVFSGVVLAFIQENLDTTLRSPQHVEEVLGLPCVAVIPADSPSAGKPKYGRMLPLPTPKNSVSPAVELVSHNRPKSELAEAYRALRTSILLSNSGRPPKVILLTSALPQEGKTTTSTNCAIVLAQRGARVLLVDADMRRPGVRKAFGLEVKNGLSSLLAGNSSFEDVVVRMEGMPNLHIVPAGPIAPQPAELLGSAQMNEYLSRWRQEYDHVVIDSPPALTVTDAVVLSVEADAVILIVRSHSTSKDALRRTLEMLAQVNVFATGVVLNGVDMNEPGTYYYGYKYGGRYYEDGTRSSS
ncbi:MAG: GumC family protein [Terriglobales bacterium]